MALLINFAAFQVAWFAAVLSAAGGRPEIGAVVMLAAIALHLYRSPRPRSEAVLVGLCGIIGGLWDSVLVSAGWVAYASGMVLPSLAPYWIVGMWMLFATTLNVSLGWLKGRALLAAVFGAAGGPLAYVTGAKLGGIVLVEQVPALVALAVGWGVMMPLLLRLADRFDGVTTTGSGGQSGLVFNK